MGGNNRQIEAWMKERITNDRLIHYMHGLIDQWFEWKEVGWGGIWLGAMHL